MYACLLHVTNNQFITSNYAATPLTTATSTAPPTTPLPCLLTAGASISSCPCSSPSPAYHCASPTSHLPPLSHALSPSPCSALAAKEVSPFYIQPITPATTHSPLLIFPPSSLVSTVCEDTGYASAESSPITSRQHMVQLLTVCVCVYVCASTWCSY